MEGILAWLTGLPPAALYAALALTAAAENVFPPLPADTVVAFGAFLAARGDASLPGAFLATWIGNVAGAMLMYALGRRFGAAWLARRIPALGVGDDPRESRVGRMYVRWGVPALFLSRFLPAARALVPPVAGALRVPVVTATIAIALASGVWYGTIAVIAYNVGAEWESIAERMRAFGKWAAVVAVAVVAVVALTVWIRRRSR